MTEIPGMTTTDEIMVRLEEALEKIDLALQKIERNDARITVLEDYVEVHEPWSQDGRKIIQAQNERIEERSQALEAKITTATRTLETQINGVKDLVKINNATNSPTAWRGTLTEVLRDVLPDELLNFEKTQQAMEDQRRGAAFREWKEHNLTPKKILITFWAAIASPAVFLWFLNYVTG